MQKIIIDTNVIVSSLIQRGYPYHIIFDLFIDDNKILELADECGADFVITGNSKDFTFPLYKQTKIVTPRDYWETYKPVE
jgi:predicted nucleic acid-binding protein